MSDTEIEEAMKEIKAIYRCQGCGAWLDEDDLVELDNGALVHTVYESSGSDCIPIPCGPIDLYAEECSRELTVDDTEHESLLKTS
jgi:hypothetical protein